MSDYDAPCPVCGEQMTDVIHENKYEPPEPWPDTMLHVGQRATAVPCGHDVSGGYIITVRDTPTITR